MENTYIKEKSITYDIAKVIATLLVVFGHATRMYTVHGIVQPTIGSAFFSKAAEVIYSFHMPLFFLLTGGIYGVCIRQGKYQDVLVFLSRKAKRLLIPYVTFGVLYVAPVMVIFHFTEMDYFQYVIYGILLSYNSRHLWYLLALFWIFILTIPLKKFLFHFHGLLILLSGALLLVSLFFPSLLQLNCALYYQWFFMIGIVLDEYYEKIINFLGKKNRCITAILLLLVPFCSLIPIPLPAIVKKLLLETVGATAVFLGIALLSNHESTIDTHFYQLLQKENFGIYLFRPMIIYNVW